MWCKYLPVVWLLLPALVGAQTDEVFSVKKPPEKNYVPQPGDTFIQRVYVSQQTETETRIAYCTGIQIEDQQTLVLFKATQGIVDSLKWLTEKNSLGIWKKVRYALNRDTLYFTFDEMKPRTGNQGRMVRVTYSYIAVIQSRGLAVTEMVSSDTDTQVPPRTNTSLFGLITERLQVRRRN